MAEKTLAMIYARSLNRCIGQSGGLPWHLPDEFKHFKQTTLGNPIIMGRKTFEDHKVVLPGRLNLVVSRNADYQVPEPGEVLLDVESAMERAWESHERIFIIGGAALFEYAYRHPRLFEVFETVVDVEVAGDTFLPSFDFSDWQTEVMAEHPSDVRHTHSYTVYRHNRVP